MKIITYKEFNCMCIKFAGIVILYNPDKTVIKNIKSYCNFFDQLLLVDNSSYNNENEFDDLIQLKNIVYIPLMSNKGISYAMNYGFYLLKDKNINYIITLDQDSSFGTNIIEEYRKYIMHHDMKNIMALTPKYSTDRTQLSVKEGYEEIKITMQSGSLFSYSILEQIGKFNDELFLDVVDWEFFVRGRKKGLRIIRCNNAILLHQPADTVEKKIGKKVIRYGVAAPVRYYYQIRNLLWAAMKYKYPYFLFIFFIKWAKIIFLFDNKNQYIKYGRKAVRDAFSSNLGIYNEK